MLGSDLRTSQLLIDELGDVHLINSVSTDAKGCLLVDIATGGCGCSRCYVRPDDVIEDTMGLSLYKQAPLEMTDSFVMTEWKAEGHA